MIVRAVVLAAVALNAVAAAVAIDRGMPAEWGGVLNGDPDNVLGEWLTWRGTAIAPPLPLMVAFAALAFLLPRRWALWGLTLLAAGGIVGYLGEPATWQLGWATTPFAWAGIVLYGAIAWLGFVALSHRVDPARLPIGATP